jgi:soluble lytic murein transglycosylase-like protein
LFSHGYMMFRGPTSSFSWLSLCFAAGFAFHSNAAKADVFEIGGNGEWQQVNKPPVEPEAEVIAELVNDGEKLPPVKLAAITASGQPISSQQSYSLPATPVRGQLASVINAAAQQYGISPALIDAVMWQESRYNHNAKSSAGAIGLMQLMPGTAQGLGVNPHDPWQNVFGGAAYLRQQLDRFNNNVPLALAAYNAGPGAVIKYGGIPPYSETRNYVASIMRRLNQ